MTCSMYVYLLGMLWCCSGRDRADAVFLLDLCWGVVDLSCRFAFQVRSGR